MSTRGVFLDRDGVINRYRADYVRVATDFEYEAEAPEAFRLLGSIGAPIVVVTNQSGIVRGYYDEAALHRLHAWVDGDLARRTGARFDAVYHCPYLPDAPLAAYAHPDHPDRKPNPGMLLRAIAEHGLDPARCTMVGDKASDMEAARAAGVAGRLFAGGDLRDALAGVI